MLAVVLFVANAAKVAWKCIKGKRQRLTRHTAKLVAVWLLLFYFLYLMLLRRALDVFNCNQRDPPDGYTPVCCCCCESPKTRISFHLNFPTTHEHVGMQSSSS